jgi:hypothetical protein
MIKTNAPGGENGAGGIKEFIMVLTEKKFLKKECEYPKRTVWRRRPRELRELLLFKINEITFGENSSMKIVVSSVNGAGKVEVRDKSSMNRARVWIGGSE